jgi:hypothetical protein
MGNWKKIKARKHQQRLVRFEECLASLVAPESLEYQCLAQLGDGEPLRSPPSLAMLSMGRACSFQVGLG